MFMRMALAGLACLAFAGAAQAEKPPHAGNPGKNYDRNVSQGGPPGRDSRGSVSIVIGDRDRDIIRRYYGDQFRAGNCPPGLAKKNNGCMPPGQAKKWAVGRPLPRDLRWYDLPRDLVVRLRPPGDGYKYVRAAGDVLLIAIGTMMVIDAVEDLGRL
ncbi:MAG: hypothetical protein AB7F36_11275 [Reyranellaceae bacterium]